MIVPDAVDLKVAFIILHAELIDDLLQVAREIGPWSHNILVWLDLFLYKEKAVSNCYPFADFVILKSSNYWYLVVTCLKFSHTLMLNQQTCMLKSRAFLWTFYSLHVLFIVAVRFFFWQRDGMILCDSLQVLWFEEDSRSSLVDLSTLPALLNSSCLHQLSPLFNISSEINQTNVCSSSYTMLLMVIHIVVHMSSLICSSVAILCCLSP